MNIDVINEDDCMEIYNHLMIERQKHTCDEKRNIVIPCDTMEKMRAKSFTKFHNKFKQIYFKEEDEPTQNFDKKKQIEQPITNNDDEKVNTLIEFYKYEYSMNI